MGGFANGDFHEHLQIINDPATRLTGVIAVHSTALGPAAGGCRLWRYSHQEQLVEDALRLSRGMSYKNALAGLPFGGGKAVLQRPEGGFDRSALFRAFGQAIDKLGGRYVTAEDVGTTTADMHAVRECTRYVGGLETKDSVAGGDPSPWTALGVFQAMNAAADSLLGLKLADATVAVQGIGNVGNALCRLLAKEGARLIVADINEARAAALAKELGATQVGADEILETDAQICAPCGLGGVLNGVSIPKLRAQLICGGANNQLEYDEDGDALRERGIYYAPDYVVNAGGIISIAAEYLGWAPSEVATRVRQIAPRLLEILRDAENKGVASNTVADELARRTIRIEPRNAA